MIEETEILYQCAKEGNLQGLKELVEKGADIKIIKTQIKLKYF